MKAKAARWIYSHPVSVAIGMLSNRWSLLFPEHFKTKRPEQCNAEERRTGTQFIAVHLLENRACLSAGSLSNAIVYSTSMPGVRPVHCCIFSTIAMPSQPATDVLSEHRSLTSLASFVFKSHLRTQISSTQSSIYNVLDILASVVALVLPSPLFVSPRCLPNSNMHRNHHCSRVCAERPKLPCSS